MEQQQGLNSHIWHSITDDFFLNYIFMELGNKAICLNERQTLDSHIKQCFFNYFGDKDQVSNTV